MNYITQGPDYLSGKKSDVQSGLDSSRLHLLEGAVHYLLSVIDQPRDLTPTYPEQWSKMRYTAPNALNTAPTISGAVSYESTQPTNFVVPEKETLTSSSTARLSEREIALKKARYQTDEAINTFLAPDVVDPINNDGHTPIEWLNLLGNKED